MSIEREIAEVAIETLNEVWGEVRRQRLKEYRKQYYKKWAARNRSKLNEYSKNWARTHQESIQETQQKQLHRDRTKHTYKGMIFRAKQRGFPALDFDLAWFDSFVSTRWAKCEICSQSMEWRGKHNQNNLWNVDRIDNKRGYLKDNLAIICQRCNRTKNDAEPAELERIAAWMRSRGVK